MIKNKNVIMAMSIVSVLAAFMSLIFTAWIFDPENISNLRGYIGVILAAAHLYIAYRIIVKKIVINLNLFSVWLFLSSIVIVGTIFMASGLLKHVDGQLCSGFFGTQVSCIESAQLSVFLLLYNFYSAIVILVASSIAFYVAFKAKKSNPKSVKRLKK